MSGAGAPTEWEEALSDFWASKLEDIKVYMPLHRAVMTVRVVRKASDAPEKADRRVMSWHELAFERVTRFTFADADASVWTSTELIDISVRKLNGRTEYAFDVAGIEDALTITCEDVRVTFLRDEEVHVSEVR